MNKRFWMTALAALAVMGGCAWGAAENTVTIPNSTVRIESRAFQGNTSLETVIIPNPATEVAPDAFEGCSENLRVIAVPGGEAWSAWSDTEKSLALAQSDFRALVIGLSYEGANGLNTTVMSGGKATPILTTLKSTINDAKGMQSVLQSEKLEKSFDVKYLENSEATKDGIINAIESTFGDATEDDVSLFYYAGHASINDDMILIGYDYNCLVNNNGTMVNDSLIGYIPLQLLKNKLDQIKGRKVLIIDACYSGLFIAESGEDKETTENLIGKGAYEPADFTKKVISTFTGTTGLSSRAGEFADSKYYVLVAAATTEKSYGTDMKAYTADGQSKWHGYFTYCLGKGLGWDIVKNEPCDTIYADQNGDHLVTIKEIGSYTRQEVTEMLIDKPQQQTAQYYPTNDPHPFAVFRYTDD